MEEHKKAWDDFYSEGTYVMRWPSEELIRFVCREIKRKKKPVDKVLDLGCANGRNLIYLAKEGFSVCGIDISTESLAMAEKNLEKEGLKGEVKEGDIKEVPYPDEYFDFVISYGVLDHVKMEDAQKAMQEVHRILKPNGIVWLTLRASMDSEHGKGEEVAKNTFIIPEDVEAGIPQHFFDENEVKDLFKDFDISLLELNERVHWGTDKKDSRWTVAGVKK